LLNKVGLAFNGRSKFEHSKILENQTIYNKEMKDIKVQTDIRTIKIQSRSWYSDIAFYNKILWCL